jgi:hypothetical protein
MHGGQARYVAFGSNWIDSGSADGQCVLPPDIEPLPERADDTLKRWLAARHIATCDRDAALTGMRIGEALADFVLAVARAGRSRPLGNVPTAAPAGDATPHASLPRLRRSAFYRRARALQFKRNPAR